MQRSCISSVRLCFVDAKSCAGAEKKKVVLKKARVPEFITVELQPKTNVALRRVSGISHNPHLRLKVKAEQNLATVIEAVERKWVPSTVRIVSFHSFNQND